MNSKATLALRWAFSTESDAVVPGAHGRAGAERVGQRVAEGVPVDDREPQVLLHASCRRPPRPGCNA